MALGDGPVLEVAEVIRVQGAAHIDIVYDRGIGVEVGEGHAVLARAGPGAERGHLGVRQRLPDRVGAGGVLCGRDE